MLVFFFKQRTAYEMRISDWCSDVCSSELGVILIYGRDEAAIEAGRQLADRLDVTVLLSRAEGIVPPRVWAFPVRRGTIRGATGCRQGVLSGRRLEVSVDVGGGRVY